MDDRPGMPSRRAISCRWSFGALASTPPAVGYCLRLLDPPFAACSSEGPGAAFGSQWSPTLSKERLSAAYAVW